MGSKTVTCNGTSGSKYNLTLNYWCNWQDTANNISNIYVEVTLQRNDGYAGSYWNLYEDRNSVYLDVNGSRVVSKNMKIDTRNGALVTLASWSGNITHNADGSKTVAVGGGFTFQSTTLSSGSVSDNFVLSTIPRKSDFSLSASSIQAGQSITVTISPASSSFTHRVVYTFGSNNSTSSLSAGSKTSTKTIPLSWLSAIPNNTAGTASVKVETLSGGTVIGEVTRYFTVTCPSSVVPSISSVPVVRIDNNVPSGWGIYVKGESQAQVSVSGASGIYGSTITGWQISGAGFSSNSSTLTTGVLNTAGSYTFTVRVTDSRGRSASATSASITVEEYSPPALTVEEVFRCNADGTRNDGGNYLSVKADMTVSTLGGKNAGVLSYRIARVGQSPGDYVSITPGTAAIVPNVSSDYSYTLYLRVADQIHSSETTMDIATAAVTMNFSEGGNGIGIGKVSERDGLEVAWPAYFESDVSIGSITGLLKGTNGKVAQAVAGTDYATPAQVYGMIESGSNERGHWIKFADGTMIVYQQFSFTTNINNAFGALYYGYYYFSDFPVSFISTPRVAVTLIDSNVISAIPYNIYNTKVDRVYLYGVNAYTDYTIRIDIIAIGRWK